MKRRIIAVLLGATMVASVVTGCGNVGTSKAPTTESGKVEVEIWYSGGKTAVDVLTGIIGEFNESQDEYEVVGKTQADYTETYEKLQAGIAGKKAPDIALLTVDNGRNLYVKGLTGDVGKFIAEDEEFAKDDYLEVFYNQGVSEEGDVYALPAYGTTQVMYYNLAAFDEAGIDATSIKTWQDLAAAAEKMTKAGSFVGWEPMWGAPNLIDASLSNGAQLISDDGTEVLVNSEEWVEVWESFRSWIHDDKIMKVNSGGQGWEYWYTTMDDVLQNRAGGYTGSSGDQADLDFSIVGAMEQPGFGSNPSAPTADSLQYVMLGNNTDEEQTGAYEFMKFYTSPENQAKWSMNTGYVPVRKSTAEVPEYKAYTDENPHALVPFQQAMHGTSSIIDPTNGKIIDALTIAADKVELENVSAQEALDEVQQIGQAALDNMK